MLVPTDDRPFALAEVKEEDFAFCRSNYKAISLFGESNVLADFDEKFRLALN